jgi:hypothetical protein
MSPRRCVDHRVAQVGCDWKLAHGAELQFCSSSQQLHGVQLTVPAYRQHARR